MDSERKIYINEEHPLNGHDAAKIYLDLDSNKSRSKSKLDGTAFRLSSEKQGDLGVHINTTFSITSSKTIKLLFLLNFLLSILCMVICFSLACYYWHEIASLRGQLDLVKDHFLIQREKTTESPQPVTLPLIRQRPNEREGRAKYETSENAKKFYVEDLGEDMLFVDTKKKNDSETKAPSTFVATMQTELLVAQFIGAYQEYKMGSQSNIGPWVRDTQVSSKNSNQKIQLNNDSVTIKETGLYLVYAQVVYLSHSPNTYYIWARQGGENIGIKPRLVSACATGDDSTLRSLDRAQLSCSVHSIARLYAGDTVTVSQREPNRTLIMRAGYSYFGFIKLAS